MKWSGTVGNSQAVSEGLQQQPNVPTTVTNGQPVISNANLTSLQSDRQTDGSRFNPEKSRELQKLPLLKGNIFLQWAQLRENS